MAGLAEIVLGEAGQYVNTRPTTPEQRKAIRDIASCRTEAMGTVKYTCGECGAEYWVYGSCRNRSCPGCGGESRRKWLEARLLEILPVPYLQVVFTPPPELNILAWYCPEAIYDAVIRAAGQAVIEVGSSKLHLQLGCSAQLHTWAQSMAFHLHAHFAVPCGGFSEDDGGWESFGRDDLPRKALSKRFRSLLTKNIRAAARKGELVGLPSEISVEQLLQMVQSRKWRVYAEEPFGGPEKLFEYLSRYTNRVAITNDRIVSYENHQVTFRCRDYHHRNEEKLYILEGQEFLRRYLLHVPPKGFVRIRSYGFLANRNRKKNVERAYQLIGQAQPIASSREDAQPLRLCPACYAKRLNGGPRPPFAPSPAVASRLAFTLRPPPNPALAA